MTLPNWNKSKLVRVSRLVADLHRPPKQGSSLLLNTGFPTSLLDLFLKNRDRFNKRSNTRPSPPPGHHHRDQRLAVAVPLPGELSPTLSSPMTDVASAADKMLFLGLFKVFVILGLALGAAQFAWAVAAAAFSLLSLEFLGKSGAVRFCDSKGRTSEEIVGSEREDQITKVKVMESDNLTALPEKKTEREPSTDQRRESIKRLMKRKFRHGKKREQINSIIVEPPTEERIEETRNPQVEDEKEEEIDVPAGEVIPGNRNQKTRKSCGNYPILLVIVLCGLIAGRVPALLVTVSWCLILRYVEKARTCRSVLG